MSTPAQTHFGTSVQGADRIDEAAKHIMQLFHEQGQAAERSGHAAQSKLKAGAEHVRANVHETQQKVADAIRRHFREHGAS